MWPIYLKSGDNKCNCNTGLKKYKICCLPQLVMAAVNWSCYVDVCCGGDVCQSSSSVQRQLYSQLVGWLMHLKIEKKQWYQWQRNCSFHLKMVKSDRYQGQE